MLRYSETQSFRILLNSRAPLSPRNINQTVLLSLVLTNSISRFMVLRVVLVAADGIGDVPEEAALQIYSFCTGLWRRSMSRSEKVRGSSFQM